jgi:energy-coupling factor transporter transmembrane protein EcfT
MFNPFSKRPIVACILVLAPLGFASHLLVHHGGVLSATLAAVNMASRWFLIVGSALLFIEQTDPAEILHLVQVVHRSPKLTVPLAVGLRVLPKVFHDMHQIRLCLAARGLSVRSRPIRNAVIFLQSFLFAFISGLTLDMIGLSLAVVLRAPGRKMTSIRQRHVSKTDIAVLLLFALLVMTALIIERHLL